MVYVIALLLLIIHYNKYKFCLNDKLNCILVTFLALNLAIYLLIGKTSALTLNVAGVVKDWLLIGLSLLIFR